MPALAGCSSFGVLSASEEKLGNTPVAGCTVGSKDNKFAKASLQKEGARLKMAVCTVGFMLSRGQQKNHPNAMRILESELQYMGQEINSKCGNYFSLHPWEKASL